MEKYRRKWEVSQIVENKSLILKNKNNESLILDHLSIKIWKLLNNHTIEAIFKELTKTYPSVNENTIGNDLNEFIQMLIEKELVEIVK